jgi:predicted NAD/FAD-binding protein
MNIAIIGAGASGLFVAYQLRNAGNNIDMYETQAWPGGNCFTTQVQVGNMARWADLAVNDFNQPMYQPIVDVMDQLGVAYDDLEDTESFFTSDGATQYTLDGGYGTPADPSFAGLLTAWGDAGARIMHDPTYAGMTVAQFLATDPAFKNYPQFAANCILPRVNAMYFCDDQGSSAMPVQTAFLYYYFQEGYGSGQPVRRRYFVNGSQSWAAALLKAVGSAGQFQLLSNAGTVKVIVQGSPIVFSSFGQKTYDAVVFACHAKDALTSYQGVPSDIAAILGGVKYVSSMGYAHVDPRVMPANQAAWRSYNVLIRGPQDPTNYTMSYLINDHQADAWNPRANYFGQPQYFVTLDPYIPLDPSKILFDKSRSGSSITTSATPAWSACNRASGPAEFKGATASISPAGGPWARASRSNAGSRRRPSFACYQERPKRRTWRGTRIARARCTHPNICDDCVLPDGRDIVARMPACFDTWTVLPHDPLEKLESNLWHVEGQMPDPKVRRHMTLARMRDGRVVVHNAIALGDGLMKELEAWGTPAFILVPNGFHRQDAKIWKQRYPNAKVLAPAAARKGVSKIVAVDGSYDDLPADDDVRLRHLEGCKSREGVLEVRSGDATSLAFNDTILNMPKLGGIGGFFLAPTARPSVPRFARWMFASDKGALRSDLERLAAIGGLRRVVPGHGRIIDQDAAHGLRTATSVL